MLRSEHQLMRIGDAGQHGQGIIAATVAGFDIGIEAVADGEACFPWPLVRHHHARQAVGLRRTWRIPACPRTKPVPHQWR